MIRGKNIILRALEPEDRDILFNWENDRSLWTISETFAPISSFLLEQYLMNVDQDIFTARQVRMMIVKNKDLKPIGTIELFDYHPMHQRAGIGIMIIESERGQSLASESIALMLDYCKNVLNLKQVFCNIIADNSMSLHLFQKQGFEKVGLKKDWIKVAGKWKDEFLLQKIFE